MNIIHKDIDEEIICSVCNTKVVDGSDSGLPAICDHVMYVVTEEGVEYLSSSLGFDDDDQKHLNENTDQGCFMALCDAWTIKGVTQYYISGPWGIHAAIGIRDSV